MELLKQIERTKINNKVDWKYRPTEEIDIRLMTAEAVIQLTRLLDGQDSPNTEVEPFYRGSELFIDVDRKYILSNVKEIYCNLVKLVVQLQYDNDDLIGAMQDSYKTGMLKEDVANIRTRALRLVSSLSTSIHGLGATFYCFGALVAELDKKYNTGVMIDV